MLRLGASGATALSGLVGWLGKLVSWIPGIGALTSGLGKAATAMKGASVAARMLAGATGIGLVLAAIAGLIWGYQQFTKTGKEMAKAMEDQIGKSQDMAMSYKGMVAHMERTSMAMKKLRSAMDKVGDSKGLQEALNARSYKSAAVAAQKFSDTMGEASNAIAAIDPSRITGIDEFGNYVVGLSGEFKNLAVSAVDARNAITSALQVKQIQNFSKDLREPVGFLDKMSQGAGDFLSAITGGAIEAPDMSP